MKLKLNKDWFKTLWQRFLRCLQNLRARWRALPVDKRKDLIKSAILFVFGVLVGILLSLVFNKTSSSTDKTITDNTASAVALSPNAIDWGDLVAGMCQTKSPVNLLAMKLDFPFSQCMRDNGQIDGACVQQDAARFQAALPMPYQQSLGAVEAKVSSMEDGSQIVYYVIPLKDAAFQQLPLTALAVHINTKVGNSAPLGWQTPHLVIQGDYSTIQNVIAQNAPPPQPVYYADIPSTSDALPGPFANLDEAKIATRRAGGRTSKIKKYNVSLTANFLDGVNEVALSCVPQQAAQ